MIQPGKIKGEEEAKSNDNGKHNGGAERPAGLNTKARPYNGCASGFTGFQNASGL